MANIECGQYEFLHINHNSLMISIQLFSQNQAIMQPRKYITVQRSANKQPQRASYQLQGYRETYDTNFHGDLSRYGSNNNILKGRGQRQEPKMKYSEMHKSPSEANFKTREEIVKGNIAKRRGDGMVSNLKSQLQNLKMEVSKLMNKQTDTSSNKAYSSRKINLRDDDDLDSQSAVSLGNYGKDISDTVSVTSQKIIDEPLRRLQSKLSSANYDHTHYLELQNDLLKTELRNLKNKYNATKQQLKQKCEALQRKNQYLQISLRRSQQALSQCKKSLQVEVQTIKFQLTRKLQQQYDEEQKRTMQPVRDNLSENQFVQEKLNKLYEELAQKSKTISSINLDLTEVKGELEKKSFQLKKQTEKTSQLSKQLQFSKRQTARSKNLLQIQLTKKVQLTKTVESLREKNNELSKQLHLQNQIVNGSQQLQDKFSREIQQYRLNEQRLTQQNFELQNQIRKLKQLIDSHQQQIRHLKNTINQFTVQIEQGAKSLRIQKQKHIETEQSYRKMLDEAKENSQRQIQILQNEFDKYRESAKQIVYQNEVEQVKSKQNFDLKEKERQISKWKAEYKMLKIKFDEHFAIQNNKKQQLESYYRNYKESKSKNKILEMRNKVLEQSANQYIQKIQNIESSNLQYRVMNMEKINFLALENQQLTRKVQYMNEQLNELRGAVESEIQRANSQEELRKDIQKKVLSIDLEDNNQIMQIIEKIKKRVSDQDQKINKYIKEMKTKDNLVKQLKKQIKNMLEGQETELQKFRNKQIADCVHEIQNKTFTCLEELKNQSKKQMSIQIQNNKQLIQQNAKMKSELSSLQTEVADLKEQVKNISHLYNLKTAELQQFTDKHEFEISTYSTKLEQVEKIKNNIIKSLQTDLANKNQEIQNSRLEIKKYLIVNKNTGEDQNFDEALKAQIQGSKKLRDQLNKKNQQVYRLRDSCSLIKAQLDNLKSQSDIAKLKFISDKKNIQIQFDVESQSLRSQLSLQQKKTSSLQQKIKLVVDENKKKDVFIQNYIMSKKLPQNEKQLVAVFLKQYEICITGKGISEKLQTQSQQLEKLSQYNFNLMKEIAQMKQKLLLYEAISVDNSQMRDSHISDVDTPQKNLMKSQSIAGRRNLD